MDAAFRDDLARAVRQATSRSEYFDPSRMIREYDRCPKRNFVTDPFDIAAVIPVRKALDERRPWSVVRIGDAEISLLAYGAYADTPLIDRFLADAAITRSGRIRKQNHLWYTVLSDLMMYAVTQADVVGVAGTWHAVPHDPREYIPTFWDKPMRIGAFRAMDFMLHLMSRGVLRDKIVAPAHLYFSVLRHLDMLLESVETVFVLSSRHGVTEKLRCKYGGVKFIHVDADAGKSAGSETDSLDFLMSVHSGLPSDMEGTLSLVGSGIWAEIYCTWIKNRGGVAIDVGSGLDLLDGELTRPVHRRLGENKMREYAL